MYTFGRSLHGLLWGPVVLLGLGLVIGSRHNNASALPREEMTVKTKMFSQEWVEEYGGDKLGCEMGRGSYSWRGAGLGSNMNNLLNAWVYALAGEGWSDLSVIISHGNLAELECSHESGGLVSHGWSCIFSNTPHLCTFDTTEAWNRHMNASGISEEDQNETDWFSLGTIMHADFSTPLKALDIDQLGAKAVMAKYLWSSMTPWLRQDVNMVTHVKETFEKSPFIGIHIRRGDKLHETHDLGHAAEEYLAAALKYLEDVPTRTPAENIKGIWVASDDETAVNEVRSVANAYFPNVLSEDIVYVAGGVPDGVQIAAVPTMSSKQVYADIVYLIADLEQLAAASVFVGTFSSNMGRLVVLLREGVGQPRNTSLSLDYPWGPNRKRKLALD